ncbi:TPA: hypothetical protein H1012_03580 [archaeon]|nr:hypothetical protein [Candidatus Naiadarchaeales archaeon SRR2090153.bin461]HIK02897.1 hypothetical protein [Candidatus Naiadarchaeales archaeon SRR2090159.bin1288]
MKLQLNRKGITPIIAVILLLMMTIAIAGLAYTWLQRLQTSVQSGTENTSTQFIGSSKVKLVVDGYNTTCTGTSSVVQVRIFGRNAGTEPAKNVYLYVDDALTNASVNSSLNPGVSTSWGGCQGSGTCSSGILIASGESCATWINKTRVVKLSSDEMSAERSYTFKCTTGSC